MTSRGSTTKTNSVPSDDARNSIYSIRLIKHEEMTWVYAEIHMLVNSCIHQIASHTGFVDFFIVDCCVRSGAGLLRNQSIFEDEAELRKRGIRKNRRYSSVQISLQRVGFEFVVHQAFGGLPIINGSPFKATKRFLPFTNAVYTILSESFFRATKGYNALIDRSLVLRSKINCADSTETALQLGILISNTEEQLSEIEHRLRADRNTLYGVVRQVTQTMHTVCDYHEQIISSFERLSTQEARRYARSDQQALDNAQDGLLGLKRAVYYYDPRRNKALSGIARWWIKAAILLNLKTTANLIGVPPSIWQQHRKYEERGQELGIQGNSTELSKVFGHPVEEVEEIYRIIGLNSPTSIDAVSNVGSDGENNLRVGDSISDNKPNPEEDIVGKESVIPKYFQYLTREEQRIVCCIFGTFDYYPEQETLPNPRAMISERLSQIATQVYWEKIKGQHIV